MIPFIYKMSVFDMIGIEQTFGIVLTSWQLDVLVPSLSQGFTLLELNIVSISYHYFLHICVRLVF